MVSTITPELLRQRLLDDGQLVIVDTRDESSFESWHLPNAVNYPFTPDESIDAEVFAEATGTGPDDEIVTVCAKGKSSSAVVTELEHAGYTDVAVLQDGMEGWSRLYEIAAIPTVATALEIFQVQRVAKGCLGYVVGTPRTGEAIVVDPTRHLDEFQWVVDDDDMEIVRVIDTHIHADHISGGRNLADETGATYHLPATARDRDPAIEYTPLHRNEVIQLGDVEIKAVATPGHTTESMSLLVGAEAIITGDTLFVDGVGRTELQYGDNEAASGARQLYDSIHGSILSLPDDVTVLPGHFDPEAEAVLERVGTPISAPIRDLRTRNGLLAEPKESFVDQLVDRLPEKPPNYERLISINTGIESPDDDQEATEMELGPNRCAVEAD